MFSGVCNFSNVRFIRKCLFWPNNLTSVVVISQLGHLYIYTSQLSSTIVHLTHNMTISYHQLFMQSIGSNVSDEPQTPERRSRTTVPTTPDRSPNYLHFAVESSFKRRRKRLRSQLRALEKLRAAPGDTTLTYDDTLFDSPSSDTSEMTFWSDVFDKDGDNDHVAWTSPTRSLLI